MIDWSATGIYIAYPTTDVLKLTYPGHRTYVNHKHTKVGMAKRSFRARAADYKQVFQGEIEFVPVALVHREFLSTMETYVLAELLTRYKTVGYTQEWFDTDDRRSIVSLLSNVAQKHSEIAPDLENFNILYPVAEPEEAVPMSPQEAQLVLEALANGADPETGELLNAESILHKPRVIRALFLAATVLGRSTQRIDPATSPLAKAGNPWSENEDLMLLSKYDGGASVKSLANLHSRTAGAINSRLVKLGRLTGRPAR